MNVFDYSDDTISTYEHFFLSYENKDLLMFMNLDLRMN